MPEFAIIDTHVHFWDSGINALAWTRGIPALDRPFGPADLDADLGPVELAALVAVEADVDAGLFEKEASWLAGLARDEPRLRAIVAHAPLEHGPAVGSTLEKLAALPLVRGVRRLIQDRDAAALCGDAGFREALRMLPRFGLHFELGLRHDQLGPVLDLVDACPEVCFVLDHLAKPAIAADERQPWWDQIGALGARTNVDCKVSGLVTEADPAAWNEAQLRPYIDRALDVFGPERVVFGSDWPVVRRASTYPRWVEVVDAAVADWALADRRRLFVDNARRIYRL